METKIVAGQHKGRKLENPDTGTRPLTHRMKTSLFDLIRDILPDANVLDLYAGGGNFGIEALSRGAKTATFIDIAKKAIESITYNLNITGYTDHGSVVQSPVSEFIIKPASERLNKFNITEFDIIFADPPYGEYLNEKHITSEYDQEERESRGKREKKSINVFQELELATSLLSPTGTFIIKHPTNIQITRNNKLGGLTQIYAKKYGKNSLSFFQKA
jgi:16S rRNA (guanine(966)-N(2))-methyltransferase RsmD